MSKRIRLSVVCIIAVAVTLPACFAFDNLPPPLDLGASLDSGTPDAPGSDAILALRDAAYVCSLVARCDGLAENVWRATGVPVAALQPAPTFNFAACVDVLTHPSRGSRAGLDEVRTMLSCVAATSTCGLAATCTGFEATALDAPICNGKSGQFCSGTDVVDCTAHRLVHCGSSTFAAASHCVAIAGDPAQAVCATGVCTGDSVQCTGSYAGRCGNGLSTSRSCSLLGASCIEGSGCIPDVPACQVGETRCEGDVLLTCNGATFTRTVCSVHGETCLVDGPAGGPARCGVDSGCAPRAADRSVCQGAQVSVCVAGKGTLFDCASIGLGCLPASADGKISGRCGAL